MSKYIFPAILIALQIGAGIVYALHKDFAHGGVLVRRCGNQYCGDGVRDWRNEG